MRTVLISGAGGFVGRHMARALLDRGDYVMGFDHLPLHRWDVRPEGRPGMWAPVQMSAVEMFGTGEPLSGHMDKWDLVIHCAFHVGGRAAIDSDRAALAKNLMLDAAMFDWAVRTRQPRVLYFSSSAVYPTWLQKRDRFDIPPAGYRLKESDTDADTGRPDADYGYAKMVGEQLAENAREMGVNVHVVRPFSGYAEDQSLDYPFPSIVKRARVGDLTVWGPEGQTRDWIHIDDLVAGALAVVDQDVQTPVNLCTGIGTEMGELAVMVNRMAGGNALMDEVEYLTDKPTGVFNRVGDPTLFHTIYTPKVSIEEGVRRALA